MSIRPSHALLAVLAMVASPALTQETAEPATGAATEQAAPDQAPAETAPMADPAAPDAAEAPAADAAPSTQEAAADGPKPGEYYVKSTHQDWTIRCIKTDQDMDPCELYQLMKDGDGNSVAEMTLIPLSDKEVAAGATLVAPLETDLIKGIGLAVDNGKARGYPFSFCAPVGCVARMGFTQAELDQLKRGNKATISLMPFGGDPKNPVQLDLSLKGFTAAFNELSEMAAAARKAAE